MRRVLVAKKAKIDKALAEKLGCPEIAYNVPRFEGHIKILPSVVIESATNPGVIIGVFNASKVSKEQLDNLIDLPEQEKVEELATIVANLKTKTAKLESQIIALEKQIAV